MNNLTELQRRVFCPKCGCTRIRTSRQYAVCPNGHGKLVRKFTKAETKRATLGKLPEATRINKKHFAIKGRKGLWSWINSPAKPGDKVEANQMIARYMPGGAMWVRVFTKVAKDGK